MRIRPSLVHRLDEVWTHRLTVVEAGPGGGKSTVLSTWAEANRAAWYVLEERDDDLRTFVRGVVTALRLRVPGLDAGVTAVVDAGLGPGADERDRADAVAALVAAQIERHARGPTALVIDDLHTLRRGGATARFVEALVRAAPPTFHLLVASREEVPFPIHRLRAGGEVLDVAAGDLRLDRDAVAEVLATHAGTTDPEVVDAVWHATGGWPAVVRLAAEALGRRAPEDRSAVLDRIASPEGALHGYLVGEVFGPDDADGRRLLGCAAVLDRFTIDLLGHLGVPDADTTFALLVRRAVFVDAGATGDGWHALGALVRAAALTAFAPPPDERPALLEAAATWCLDHGHDEEALRLLTRARRPEALARAIARCGPALLERGDLDAVEVACRSLPAAHRTATVERLHAEALQLAGSWSAALGHYEAAADAGDELSSAVAWRMGLIHHLRGDLDEALTIYARGRPSGGVDDVLLASWTATAHWLRGDLQPARQEVETALVGARKLRDDRAVAAAHTAAGLLAASDGDPRANDQHYLAALEAAERAGDLLQVQRIRVNRGSHFLEAGAFAQALAETEQALHLAELTGFAMFVGLARTNRAEILLRMGRLEEALADAEAGRTAFEQEGSRNAAYALRLAGDVQRARGDVSGAEVAYRDGLLLAEATGDVQASVPLLTGLARVLAGDDLDGARAALDRARAASIGLGDADVEVTAGWIALVTGDHASAARHADLARRIAAARGQRPHLAEAAVIGALSRPPEQRARALSDAARAWERCGDPLWTARVTVAAARMAVTEPASGSAGGELDESAARRILADADVRGGTAVDRLLLGDDGARPVAVQVLGGLRVVLDGVPVRREAWRSRKARELLGVLVVRRGRPVTREELGELLWPDEPPAATANRLSVALTVVRSVLDPGRDGSGQRCIVARGGAVALSLADVEVDVVRFIELADEGLRAGPASGVDGARALEAAEALYVGEVLADEPYADWANELREAARTTYLQVCHALAQHAIASGDHETVVRLMLRAVEHDPYDEPAHLRIVAALAAAGRHGEARRRHLHYVGRMEEIGIEPVTFPAAVDVGGGGVRPTDPWSPHRQGRTPTLRSVRSEPSAR